MLLRDCKRAKRKRRLSTGTSVNRKQISVHNGAISNPENTAGVMRLWRARGAVSFPLKSMCECTSAAAPALTGLHAPLQQNTHCFYFGQTPQQFGTIHCLRDRKSGVKRIIREIAKIKSPIFRVIFFNCAKGFPLK